jgi:uncharacterized membrane protein YhaH (DUF805 family)
MKMITAYKNMWLQGFDFNGRASRGDYWWAVLGNFIVSFVLGFALGILGVVCAMISEDLGSVIGILVNVITSIYSLAIFIPSLALGWRRMHDLNKSGLVYLGLLLGSSCTCGITSIIAIIFFAMPGTVGDNQYGPDPLGNDYNPNGTDAYSQYMNNMNNTNQYNQYNNNNFQ